MKKLPKFEEFLFERNNNAEFELIAESADVFAQSSSEVLAF